MKVLRKFAPALALAGAIVAGSFGGSAKAQVTATFTSGFQIQNLSSSIAHVSMQFFPEDSSAASATVPADIPANGQVTFASLPSAVTSGFKGSAVVSSDQRIAAIVNLISPSLSNLSLGSAYVGVTGGSQTVSLPLLFKNSFGFTSFFSVQNVGTAQTTVNVAYSDGSTDSTTLQPGASHRFDQGAKASLPAGFNGSATLTSTASDIAAVVTEVGPTTALTYNGFASGTTNPIFPLINANNGGFITGIALQNTGTASTNVTVKYTASSGGATCTETQTIAAKSTKFFALGAFGASTPAGVTENCTNGTPAAGPSFVGSAIVTANSASQPLVGIVNQLNSTTNKGGAYSSFSDAVASAKVVLPLIQDNIAGFFTGVSIVNVGSVSTPIECTYSGSAVKQSSPAAVPAGGSFTVVQIGKIASGYNGSGTCTATAPGARIVGVANQLRNTGSSDTFYVYEGTNN